MKQRLNQLLTFFQENPEDPFILFALAKEYEKLEDRNHALQYYLKLKQEHPDYIGTYYHLGKFYEQEGQLKAAFNCYQKGMLIAKKIGDQHALGELAGAKLNLGDEEDFLS